MSGSLGGVTEPSTPEEAIRRTITEYCHLCDDGRFDEWSDLFTPDATFVVMGGTQTGRDAITTWIARAQGPEARGKHITSNHRIEVADDGATAKAVTDYLFVARVDGGFAITSVGRYHDTFVRDPDRWRFTRREIVFLGDTPAR